MTAHADRTARFLELHREDSPLLTARAENYLHGKPDLHDTITRLQAYQEAGADVLYAPALDRPEDLRELLSAVDLPVNVLARSGTPPVAELAEMGVKRISVGGGFAFAAYGAAAQVAGELLNGSTYSFTDLSRAGAQAAHTAFAAIVPEEGLEPPTRGL